MNLSSNARLSLANAVIRCLREIASGSSAGLRGSLERGDADPYSDIDLFWEIPDSSFADCVEALPEVLPAVAPIESIRFEPMLQNSEKRRLVYVQFSEVPLYWRVDIEIFAESINRDSEYDRYNSNARGDQWSRPHSALMNAVAAIKALMRSDVDGARECLCRAFDRVDLLPPDETPWDQVATLAEVVGRCDLEQAELVRRVQLLRREALLEIRRRESEAKS